jgi:hypothetical protein
MTSIKKWRTTYGRQTQKKRGKLPKRKIEDNLRRKKM